MSGRASDRRSNRLQNDWWLIRDFAQRCAAWTRRYGVRSVFDRGAEVLSNRRAPGWRAYRHWYASESAKLQELPRDAPGISLLCPVRDTQESHLLAMYDSLCLQTEVSWELCIADDGSTSAATRTALAGLVTRDDRVLVRRFETSKGIAAATNAAAELAQYDVFGLLDHDDLLPRGVLQRIARAFATDPALEFVYTDEDQITDWGLRVLPTFKPGPSPILSLGFNYVGHFVSLRRSLFEALEGLDPRFDGSQDHDLILRAFEKSRGIRHLPGIGYHWRRTPGSVAAGATAKEWAYESGRRAVAAACRRRNLPIAAVLPTAKPGVFELQPAPPTSPRPCWLVLHGNAVHVDEWRSIVATAGDCVALRGVSVDAFPDHGTVADWILIDAALEPDAGVLRALVSWSAMPGVGSVVTAHRVGTRFRDLGYSISRTGAAEPIAPGLSLRGVAPGLLSRAVREVAAARPGAAWIASPPSWLRRALSGQPLTPSREICLSLAHAPSGRSTLFLPNCRPKDRSSRRLRRAMRVDLKTEPIWKPLAASLPDAYWEGAHDRFCPRHALLTPLGMPAPDSPMPSPA